MLENRIHVVKFFAHKKKIDKILSIETIHWAVFCFPFLLFRFVLSHNEKDRHSVALRKRNIRLVVVTNNGRNCWKSPNLSHFIQKSTHVFWFLQRHCHRSCFSESASFLSFLFVWGKYWIKYIKYEDKLTIRRIKAERVGKIRILFNLFTLAALSDSNNILLSEFSKQSWRFSRDLSCFGSPRGNLYTSFAKRMAENYEWKMKTYAFSAFYGKKCLNFSNCAFAFEWISLI